MKKMRKLVAVILALVMCFAMALPAMAATITVKNNVSGHTYTAYQILKGSFLKEGEDYVIGNAEWGSGVSDSYKNAHPDLQAFLDALKTAESANPLANELVETEGYLGIAAGTSVQGAENYTIDVTEPGYYLIVDQSAEGVLSAYIVEVVTDDIEVTPKTGEPTFEKKVQDVNDSTGEKSGLQDSADYDIGDSVPFTLTATLPVDGYANFEEYYLAFHDDLSDGLTRDAGSIHVYLESVDPDNEITAGFEVTNGTDDPDDFDLVFANLKASNPTIAAGSVIIVTYTATLNDNAKIGEAGNPNTATLEYSRDPNYNAEGDTKPPTGTTPKDTVIVFTYQTVIDKVDQAGASLNGAAFDLYKLDPTNPDAIPEGEDYAGYVKQAMVKADGANTFSLEGLDDGDYILVESVTPPGYNKMEDIHFTVTATHDVEKDDPQLGELGVTVTQPAGFKFTANTHAGSIEKQNGAQHEAVSGEIYGEIVNQRGSLLPSTGGIGTTIFYVVGICLVVGAVVILVTRKRVGKNS